MYNLYMNVTFIQMYHESVVAEIKDINRSAVRKTTKENSDLKKVNRLANIFRKSA